MAPQRCPPSHRLDNRRSIPSDKPGFPGWPRNLHAPFWPQVRRQLFALAYNLGNFLRRLALPKSVKHWSLTTLRDKLIKIGAKVVAHSRYVFFRMAEVAVPRKVFAAILERIQRLRAVPGMAPS